MWSFLLPDLLRIAAGMGLGWLGLWLCHFDLWCFLGVPLMAVGFAFALLTFFRVVRVARLNLAWTRGMKALGPGSPRGRKAVGARLAYGQRRSKEHAASPAGAVVETSDELVTCKRASGLVECVRWSDLEVVFVDTTAVGPAAGDAFIVLGGGEAGCVVPLEADGIEVLLKRLQELPGFDNEAYITAMTSTSAGRFTCWKQTETGPG
jgi:hypothetical protein